MPGPNAAAGLAFDIVNKDTEGSEPSAGNENIHWSIVSHEPRDALYIHIQGQEKNPDEKGISQIRPSSIDMPAITSE